MTAAMDLSFLNVLAPIFIFFIVTILIFASVIKLKVPGSKGILAFFSIIIAIVLVSSTQMVEYTMLMIPWFAVISLIIFFTLLILVFATGSVGTFGKPLAWIGFIAALFVIFCAAFDTFPTFYHLLPATSDAYLNVQLRNFKDWFWSSKVTNTIVLAISALIVGFFITKK